MDITSFRSLLVWQKAMVLVERVYELTEGLRKSELFGLGSQLRRAAISISSNIAEGHARQTGYFINLLNMAVGSEAEVQTQLELAHRLKFVDEAKADKVMTAAAEVGKMLHGLIAALERDRN